MLENVHQIDREAFKNCAFLERITFHSPDLNLAHNIFVNCPLLAVIMIAPWLWSTLFVSMNEHPDLIFTFFRHYHTQILDGGGGTGNVVLDLQRSESVDNTIDDTADSGSGDEDEDGGNDEDNALHTLSTANEDGINRVVNHDDNEDNNGNRNLRDIEDGNNKWCWFCKWWR